MQVSSLGQEDALEEEMAADSCILAGIIPWTEESGGLQSVWSLRADTTEQLSTCTPKCVTWEIMGKMVILHFLPGSQPYCAFILLNVFRRIPGPLFPIAPSTVISLPGFSSDQFSHSVMSDSLQPHELQHARPPCPSPTPGVYSNSCPSSQWCPPAISSFNMLCRLVITLLPRNKCLLISWLQSPSAVILEPKNIKSDTVSTVSPSISHEVMGPDAMILVFWMLSFQPTFSLSSFTFIKRFFSSSSLSTIRVVSSAYLKL